MAFRTCPLCEATCGLQLEIEDGRVTRIRGDAEDPFSKGFICPKGSTLGALHEDPDRLRRPLVRRNGVHVDVSWADAFAEIERRLTAITSEHGADSVAVYIGNPNAHNYANTLAIRRASARLSKSRSLRSQCAVSARFISIRATVSGDELRV